MRMSAKAEYAVRAMVQLASADEGAVVKTDDLAKAQGIPPQFLVDILSDLRTDRLVRSRRGRDGGYELARPAAEISIADVLRCIDGPLASVRDIGLGDLPYSGPTAALTDVWRALRASMRSVLEETSLADVATGDAALTCRQVRRRLPRPGAAAGPPEPEGRRHRAAHGRLAAAARSASSGDAVEQHSQAAVEVLLDRRFDGDLDNASTCGILGAGDRPDAAQRPTGPARSACAAPVTKPSSA